MLDLNIENSIATITLNKPDAHNAFDDTMIVELTKALKDFEKNPQVKVIILAANGKSFCAGADLNWMRRMANYSLDENLADANALAELMRTLNFLKKPTIALVQGAAYGGGVGLVACCDIAIATADANFCLSEVKIGLIPAVISPYVIAAMGERAARRYFLTAEKFSAEFALGFGLIHSIVDQNQLKTAGIELAKLLLANSPQAITTAKKLIQTISGRPINNDLITETAAMIAEIRVSEEGQEGLQAFIEKRKPKWIQ